MATLGDVGVGLFAIGAISLIQALVGFWEGWHRPVVDRLQGHGRDDEADVVERRGNSFMVGFMVIGVPLTVAGVVIFLVSLFVS